MFHYPVRVSYMERYMEEMQELESRSLEGLLQGNNGPIGSNAHLHTLPSYAVVKIANAPSTITRQDITHMFPRGARFAPEWPIHIVMDRSSGKTTDCFVEFVTEKDAEDAVHHVTQPGYIGQSPRSGVRHVQTSMSNHDEMLKAMFPHAKGIEWVNGKPILRRVPEDEHWSTGFSGFLTDEEMYCILRHAEQPYRNQYVGKIPQRAFESFSSTVWKFPWSATNLYTVKERNLVFRTLRFMIQALVERMLRERKVGLDRRLVSELILAGLRCPAFNPRMKWCLVYVGQDTAILQKMSEEMMLFFPFDTLTWLPPYDTVALEFYASLMAQGKAPNPNEPGLRNHWTDARLLEPYGRYWFEWNESAMPRSLKFSDCIAIERRQFRRMVTDGYHAIHGGPRSGSLTPTPRVPLQQPSTPRGSEVWRPQTPGPIASSAQLPYIGPTGELNPAWTFPTQSNDPHAAESRRQPEHETHHFYPESWPERRQELHGQSSSAARLGHCPSASHK